MGEELLMWASCHLAPSLVLSWLSGAYWFPRRTSQLSIPNIKLIPLSVQVAKQVFTGNRD